MSPLVISCVSKGVPVSDYSSLLTFSLVLTREFWFAGPSCDFMLRFSFDFVTSTFFSPVKKTVSDFTFSVVFLADDVTTATLWLLEATDFRAFYVFPVFDAANLESLARGSFVKPELVFLRPGLASDDFFSNFSVAFLCSLLNLAKMRKW